METEVKHYRRELARIVKIAKHLRSLKAGRETSWEQAAEWHLKYANFHNEQVLALTITLSPTGCEWAGKGGCTMCGEFEGAYKGKALIEDPRFHIAQFASAIGNPAIWEAARKENRPIPWLRVVQEGNYTNTKETNIVSQETILRLATRIKGVERITIESRPQYLNDRNVSALAKIVADSGVELEIGMGFEAQDDVVRNVCINKQGTIAQFSDAAKLLRKYHILPLAFVLLKPPFLTEQEAIDEAVATAHCAVEIGFSRISCEPMSIHPYTVVDALTQAGDYRAPWLWSVGEVTKRCAEISKMFGIGGLGYYPIPSEYAHNHCDNGTDCNRRLIDAILKYNATRDVSAFNGVACSCKSVWERECQVSSVPLKKRIQEQLTHVEDLLPHYATKESSKDNIMRSMRILASNSQG